jgi:hypothetical protein
MYFSKNYKILEKILVRTGTLPQTHPFSKQELGMQKIKANMDAIVQGVGYKATSFPPMDTIRISSGCILSRKKRSCGRNRRVLSFSVVASTAVLMVDMACRVGLLLGEHSAGEHK